MRGMSDPVVRNMIGRLLVRPGITDFMRRLDSERPEVFRHSLGVANHTAEIVLSPYFLSKKKRELGHDCTEDYLESIVAGALLHDIGKLSVANAILLKPGRLTDEEYIECQSHTTIGYEMLKDRPDISDLTKEIVLSHHEKIDGTGYPHHKKADDIPYEVQIVSVCDIYDAVRETRAYRDSADNMTALGILANEPISVDVFLSFVGCYDRGL